MNLKRADDWFGFEQGLQIIANTVVLLSLVTLCIVSSSKNSVPGRDSSLRPRREQSHPQNRLVFSGSVRPCR